jgi:hypothetical protein
VSIDQKGVGYKGRYPVQNNPNPTTHWHETNGKHSTHYQKGTQEASPPQKDTRPSRCRRCESNCQEYASLDSYTSAYSVSTLYFLNRIPKSRGPPLRIPPSRWLLSHPRTKTFPLTIRQSIRLRRQSHRIVRHPTRRLQTKILLRPNITQASFPYRHRAIIVSSCRDNCNPSSTTSPVDNLIRPF